MISRDLLKGTLKTIVLNLLSEGGRMYGYEITQEVEKLSEGTIQLSWGALYPTLHKLEADGLIYAEEYNIGKRIRKYYQLTPKGKMVSKDKVEEFLEYVRVMTRVLKPSPGLSLNHG
ncbi:MAG: PadR family transcriptional regulator [Bacteroidota bacterium]